MKIAQIVCFILSIGLVKSSHFRGGIIQWRPVNPSNFNGYIYITHRMSWRRSSVYCDQNTINNQNLIGSGNLLCSSGCGNLGSLSFYCTDYSTSENWSSGERTFTAYVGYGSSFEAYFSSCCWISLRQGGSSMRLTVRGTLTQRSDNGRINSSPVTAITPVIRVQRGCPTIVHIPVQDADGDDVRCRWASGSTECGGVCQTFPYGGLSGCSVVYYGGGSDGLYAVALQMEDFISSTSTTPLSSVPVQFIVKIYSSTFSCPATAAAKPILVGETLPNGACIPVPFGTTFRASIVALVAHSGIRILEFPTVTTLGVTKSPVTQSMYNSLLYYTNITWTPQPSQYGIHILCYSARDTNSMTSDQFCIVLLGGVQGPRAIKSTTSPSGILTLHNNSVSLSQNATSSTTPPFINSTTSTVGLFTYTFSVEFDQFISRPTLSSYIRIFENSTNKLVDVIDAVSSQVSFPNTTSGGKGINFTTSYSFQSGTTYYILLDLGVAVGNAFCHQESDAVISPVFWTFTAEIDECIEELDDCSTFASCIDTLAGYDCICNAGYTGDGFSCSDVNECYLGTAICPQYSLCVNTVGYYSCSCKFGFYSNGTCREPPSPNPPQAIQAQNIHTTAVTITWLSPVPQTNLPISTIIVTLTDLQFGLPQLNASLGGSYLSHTFYGLEEYNNYRCDVISVSVYGGISEKVTINFKTKATAPSAAPQNLTGVAVSASLITLSWMDPPPIDINGNIAFYFVHVTEVYTGRNLTFHSFARQITIGPFHAYYEYSCAVSVFTTSFGPYTPRISVFSGEALPTASPRNFSLNDVTPNSVELSWDPPMYEQRNGLIRYYVIFLTELSGIDSDKEITANFLSYTLTELRPAFCYNVSVAAFTIGIGPASARAGFCLLTAAPSAPPQSVNGYPESHTTFYLQWGPPPLHDQNGIIESYLVNVTEEETALTFQASTNQTSLLFSSLHPDYTYCCQITAVTVAEGPYSDPYCIRLHPGAPSGIPQNIESTLPNPYSIVLSWTPPRPEDKNGQIILYTINVIRQNTGATFQLFTNLTTLAVLQLVPYTTYTFQIAASTVAGQGPFSSQYSVTTLEDVPSEPRSASVSRMNGKPTSLSVMWSIPEITNGVIIYYTVYCDESNSIDPLIDADRVAQVNPAFTSTEITGLLPFTSYSCAVTASTSAGESNFSIIATAITDESVPGGPPENFQTTQTTSTSVTLSWSQSTVPNGVVVSYNLSFNSTQESVSVHPNGDENTIYTVTGLNEYSYYKFVVLASTRLGPGPSVSLVIQTEQSNPAASPLNMSVSVTGSTSSSVTWLPPPAADQNGVIIYYSLLLRDLQFNSSDVIVNSTTTSYTFTSLNEYNIYSCLVAAATYVGLGPYSIAVEFTTEQDVPSSSPQQVTGQAQSSSVLLFSWLPPLPVDANGIINHYNVRVTDVDSGRVWMFIAIDLHITVASLKPYHEYYCSVSAYTIGAGPFSASIIARTGQAAPTHAPDHLSVLTSSDTLTLMWEAPPSEHINGVIDHYKATLTELDAERSYTGVQYTFNSSSTVATFTSLHPYYFYECTVAAYTVALGPVSQSITVQLDEDAPTAAPTNIQVESKTAYTIHFTWQPPPSEHQNGLIRQYRVDVVENETNTITQYNTSSTRLAIYSLHPFYIYKFTVAAVTVSAGPVSQPLIVQTEQDAPTGTIRYSNVLTVTSESATIQWSPPDLANQNGIVSYRVNVTDVNRGTTYQLTTSINEVSLTSLHPFTSYVIRIAPYTSAGDGPYAAPIHLMTTEAAPTGPPEDVSITALSSTSLRVSWSPPSIDSQNGFIREYRVNVTEVNTGDVFMESSVGTFLILSDLHPFYTYECIVSAFTVAEGPSSEEIEISTPEDVPDGYPRMVMNSSTTSRSAVVSWSPPEEHQQNGIIISYTILIERAGFEESFQLVSSDTRVTLSSLTPCTSYYISVAASTSVGLGPYSTAIVLTTLEDVPTSSPVLPMGEAQDSRTIRLSWSPPDEPNGFVREYRVMLNETVTGNIYTYTSLSTSIEITSLHPAYTYECSVAAFTIGLGPYTTLFTVTTLEDAPSGPPQSLTIRNITAWSAVISYSLPVTEQQNGAIIGYNVKLTNLDSGITEQFETSDTEFLVENLRPHTVYSTAVAARTAIGIGPFSGVATFRTGEDAPGSHPTNSTGTALNATHILLTWQPPPENLTHGVIREYRINITEDATDRVLHFTVPSETRELIIGDLHPYYVYHCSIVAITVEAGPYTDVIVVETMEAAPTGSPRDLTATSQSSRSIVISWAPPRIEEQNGIVRQYLVTLTSVYGTNTLTVTAPTNFTTITGLQPYTRYECSVSAKTITLGPSTPAITVQTLEDAPSGPPVSVNSEVVNSTVLFIQWEPPVVNTRNGVIRRYYVNITEQETGTEEQYYSVNQYITITSRHPFYQYAYSISAETVKLGPFSARNTVRMPEAAPSAPPGDIFLVNITSNSFTVQWSSPPFEDRNGIVRYYTVIVTQKHSDDVTEITTQRRSYKFENQRPYSNYTFSIAAFTVASGPFSKAQTLSTLEDIPSAAPQNFNVSAGDQCSNSMILKWNSLPEEDRNGVVLGYNISVTESGVPVAAWMTVESGIRIDGLKPFTVYSFSVAAFTSVGIGPATYQLATTCEDAPSEPLMLTVLNVTSTTITLSWSAPDQPNGIVRHYFILVYETNTESNRTVISYSNFNFTVGELHPYYIYTLTVKAVTIRSGPSSETLSIQTLQDAPSGYPMNLEGFPMDSRTLFLEWDPPASEDYNGIITDYFIEISAVETGNTFQLVTGGATSATVPGLHPFYTYNYVIAAVTIAGRGPFSPSSSAQMLQDVPSLPPRNMSVESINSTAVEISWEPPEVNAQNGIITSYYIRLVDLQSNDTQEFSQPGSKQVIVVTSLHPFYSYQCELAAETAIGRGPLTIPMTVQTDEDVPSGPVTLTNLTAVSSRAVYISWEPPAMEHQNGILRGYNILVRDRITDESRFLNTTDTFILVDDLHPHYSYDVSVAAATISVGPYTTRQVKLPEDLPIGAPQNVGVDSQSSSIISISWEPPLPEFQNGIIRSYFVTVVEIETEIILQFQTHGSATFHIVNSLHPFYQYNCSVAAFTIGLGPSAHGSIRTHPDEPSDAPQNTTISTLSSTEALLMWSPPPPEHQNGIIVSYNVHIAGVDTGKDIDLTALGLQVLVTDLHPFYSYEISVAAFTVSLGPFSDPLILQMPEAAPSAPAQNITVATQTSTSVTLVWFPPDPDSWNGEVIKYTVIYVQLESSEGSGNISIPSPGQPLMNIHDPVRVTLPLRQETVLIEGLNEFSMYQFTVFFETIAGKSPSSETIDVKTLSDVPSGAPRNVSVMVLSASAMNIKWLPPDPSDRNGIIIGYHIKVQNAQLMRSLNVSGDTYSAKLEGLNSFTDFKVSVAAETTVGVGPYSESVTQKTFESVPGAPLDLTLTVENTSSVILSWIKPTQPNGIILEYQVNFVGLKNKDSGENDGKAGRPELDGYHSLAVGGSELRVLITYLKPGFSYDFTVRARNSAGFGANSSSVQFEVPVRTVAGGSVDIGSAEKGAISFAVIGWVIILVVVILVAMYLYRHRENIKQIVTCGFNLSWPNRSRAQDSIYEIPDSLQFANPAAIDEEDEKVEPHIRDCEIEMGNIDEPKKKDLSLEEPSTP